MLLNKYQTAFRVQLSHLTLCIIWNAVGVYQVSQGQQSIGPVASLAAIFVMVVFSLVFFGLINKGFERTYLALSTLPALLAIMTIKGALTQDPSLWPAEFWRYAGAVVNTVGVVGFALIVKEYLAKDIGEKESTQSRQRVR